MTDDPDQGEVGLSQYKYGPIWRLEGYDTFDGTYYPLSGEYSSLEEAEEAARRRLSELEARNPTATSGGQGPFGIQDRVYIIGPDGKGWRFTE